MRKSQKPVPEDLGWFMWQTDARVAPFKRIERLVSYYGFAGVAALGRELDPEPGSNEVAPLLSKIKNTGLMDSRTAALILHRFPELNPAWVTLGLAPMFRPDAKGK